MDILFNDGWEFTKQELGCDIQSLRVNGTTTWQNY
jgi:hypothetical protein